MIFNFYLEYKMDFLFELSASNWHLPMALALVVGTCHLTSTRIKSRAVVAADFQQPLKGIQDWEQK